MGYSKNTHHRDEISGLHVHNDIQDGTHGAEDLSARNAARQADLNAAIKRDWPATMTATIAENADPTLGNAFSRLPKPSDVVVGSKAERYGSADENEADSTRGGPPQKPTKQKGIEPPSKRA
jgi:hypothetical protein